MNKRLIFDFFVISIIIAVAFWLIFILKLNFLTQAILLFLVPSIYLIWRKPKCLLRTFVGTFLIGGLFYFFLVLVGNYNNTWFEPESALMFPYKILGLIPIDEIVWGILWVMMIIVSFEHFLERKHKTSLSNTFYWSLLAISIVDISLVIIYLTNPTVLKIPYAYTALCSLALFPVIYACYKKPHLILKIVEVVPFFALMFFIYELIGLAIGSWGFSGQYIGIVTIHTFRFPIEEVIFWFIFSSLIVLVDYELYVDDEK